MSDTPETDAAFRKGMNGKQVYEFAEKLERERDEALSDLEFRRGLYKVLEEANNRLIAANEEAVELARTLKQERDEARNKMADALQEVDLRTLDFERMKEERDEAREALAEAWRFADQWLALADGYLKRINEIQNDIQKN